MLLQFFLCIYLSVKKIKIKPQSHFSEIVDGRDEKRPVMNHTQTNLPDSSLAVKAKMLFYGLQKNATGAGVGLQNACVKETQIQIRIQVRYKDSVTIKAI